MGTTEADADNSGRKRTALISLGLLVAATAIFLYFAYRSPPQMGTSEQVFNTVDALYTAVRNEDDRRLAECENRLKGYRESGKLPAAAADSLDAIIATAKTGKWRPAAETLYDFMRGQRREGVLEEDHEQPKKGKATKAKGR